MVHVRVVLLVVAAAWCMPSSAQYYDLVWADTSSISIDEGLRVATAPGTDPRIGAYLIYRVGRSGDRSYLPKLKEIFEAERRNSNRNLPSAALRAIDDLNDDEYLLGVVAEWQTDMDNASNAIGLLAAPPKRELLQPIWSRIAGAQNMRIVGAWGFVANMARRDSVFAQASPEERVEIAVEAAGWHFSKSGGNLERELTSYPMAVAGRAWLREVSDEQPAAVAEAIRKEEVRDAPELNEERRRYLAQFTNEEVRAILGY